MNAYLAAAAILIQAVRADYKEAGNALSSAASKLNSEVNGFNSAQGINGALQIQADFPALSKAVVSAKSQISGDNSIDVETTSAFGKAVIELLDSLAKKASDFNGVGAGTIVQNDLKGINSPAADLVSGIVSAVSGDCSKISSLSAVLVSLGAAFSSADGAYSVATPSLPAVPKCNGGSGSGSSSSSKAESSVATSAATSAASSASAPSGTAASKSSSAPVAINSNGAEKAVVGAAAFVGAAALLL